MSLGTSCGVNIAGAIKLGKELGPSEGDALGIPDGEPEGESLGDPDGMELGAALTVGTSDGARLG